MLLRILAAGIAVVFCLNAPATAEMYTIDDPAENISNPAAKMSNPATQINNPASNISNPATRLDKPKPISPPTKPVPHSTITEVTTSTKPAKQIKKQPHPKSTIHKKSYHFKTVRAYINAAKKAFDKDDYKVFVSITEEALKRISAGTLKASKKEKQTLVKYKNAGYGLLGKK